MLKRLLLAAAVLAATTVSARAQVHVCSAFGQSCVSPDTTCSAAVESPTTTICSATVASSTSTTPSSLLTGLVHYWALEEASGTRNDAVGTAHLTDTNTVGSASGKHGTAASFVSTNTERLSVARPSELANGSAKTISLWANWTSGSMVPFAIANATLKLDGNPQLFFGASPTGTYKFWCSASYSTEPTSVTTGWHHWLFTDSGSVQNLYIDNVLVATRSATIAANSSTLYIGQGYWGYWNGPIDEVGVWSRILTAEERATLYNSGTGKFYPSF